MKTYKLSNGNLLVPIVEQSPSGQVEALVQIEPRNSEYQEYSFDAVPMSYEDEVTFRLLHGLPVRSRAVGRDC